MTQISTVRATAYMGEVRAGTTKPFYLDCNGVTYVAKVIDDDVGHKHLVNEYVCYCLAKILEIPIPDAALIQLDNNIINSTDFLKVRNIKSNLLFGSKLIQSSQTNIAPPFLEIIINKEDIPSIILFDQIIFNDDRATNKGNLIIDFKKKTLNAIDHTHVFKDGALWSSSSLRSINENKEYLVRNFDGKYYKMLLRYVSGNSPFAKILRIISSLKKEQIIEIVENIPDEWNISSDEKLALIDFLWHRISNKESILRKIKDVCPQWKGVIN